MTGPGDTKFIDYYALLGIPPNVDAAQIRQAFIGKAKTQHPDTGGSTDDMRRLNIAYETLLNPATKAAYDLSHSFHTGGTQPSEYRYPGSHDALSLSGTPDEAIDSFLDNLLAEYRHGPPKSKPTFMQRLKKLFEL